MTPASPIEDRLRAVSRTDRATLADNLFGFRGSFPIGSSPAFVAAADLDELRHVYFALCVQNRRVPGSEGQAASVPVARAA